MHMELGAETQVVHEFQPLLWYLLVFVLVGDLKMLMVVAKLFLVLGKLQLSLLGRAMPLKGCSEMIEQWWEWGQYTQSDLLPSLGNLDAEDKTGLHAFLM